MKELKSVSFPPGLLHIGEQAFSGDSGLKSAVFPDGLLSIGSEAFENCFKLTEVVLPSSLTYVGKNAFYGCKRLGCVFFKGSSEQWSAACFDGFDAAARVLFYSAFGITPTAGPYRGLINAAAAFFHGFLRRLNVMICRFVCLKGKKPFCVGSDS